MMSYFVSNTIERDKAKCRCGHENLHVGDAAASAKYLHMFNENISQQSCERNPSRSRCGQGWRHTHRQDSEIGFVSNGQWTVRVRGITNHHRHKKGPRDPYSVRGFKVFLLHLMQIFSVICLN